MTDLKTTIGLIKVGISPAELCTVERLKDEMAWAVFEKCPDIISLARFVYDPFTGERINWKKVKQLTNRTK